MIGLLIVMGAMGGMDEPANPLLPLVGIAFVGLAMMYFGTNAMKEQV
jgi:hypothetical protein